MVRDQHFEQPPNLILPNPERFAQVGIALSQRQRQLFDGSLLTTGHTGYFKIIRHALGVVRFNDKENGSYSKWLETDIDEAIEIGWDSPRLTDDQLITLASEDDPAAFVIGRMEVLRQRQPNITFNEVTKQRIFSTYALFAAGVHRERVFVQ